MQVFKFIVPKDVGDNPDVGYGYLSLVLAENEDAARAMLTKWSTEEGLPTAWLHNCDVHSFPLNEPAVLGWVQAK